MINQDVRNGLVFDMPVFGNANDYSGYNNNGVVTGATLTNDRYGRANRAYAFDGVNNKYITIPDSSALQFDGNTPATFSMWLKLREFTPSGYLFVKYQNSTNFYGLYTLADERFIFITKVSGVSSFIYLGAGTYDKLNEWAHVVIRVGRTLETNAIFINGVSKTLGCNDLTNQSMAQSGSFFIGKTPGNTSYSNAIISDFRIYNKALSVAEILKLYKP